MFSRLNRRLHTASAPPLPAAGQDELHRYCTRERRSFVEVLRDFPSVRVPLPRLLELVPRLAPRYFSIASSPIAQRSPANQVRARARWFRCDAGQSFQPPTRAK